MAKRPTNYISYRQLTSNPKLNGQATDYKDHTDPKYIGPGKWHDIHQVAWEAQNKIGKEHFVSFMNNLCEKFPCSTCRSHCKEYMQNHPMKNYEDVLVEVGNDRLSLGLFVWAWKFHNAVNARLNKPQMSWDTCYNMYSGKPGLVCSKACLHAETGGEDVGDAEKPAQQMPPVVAPIINRNYYNTQPIQQINPVRQLVRELVRELVPLYTPVVQPVNTNTNTNITNFQQVPGFRR